MSGRCPTIQSKSIPAGERGESRFATTGDRAIQIGSLEATADLPVNVGLLAKGNSSRPESLVEQLRAGTCCLKVHEDWGATPAAISAFVSPVLVSLRRWYVGTPASLAVPVTALALDLRGKTPRRR